MRRQVRRKGKLLQSSKTTDSTLKNRSPLQGPFRIVIVDPKSKEIAVEGEYVSFNEAKEKVDSFTNANVDYYVHNDSSRILYSKKGSD